MKPVFIRSAFLALIIIPNIFLSGCGKPINNQLTQQPDTATPKRIIRIGYSNHDGIIHMAHIAQVLKRTNILEKNNLKAEFIEAPSAQDVSVLLLENKIDVSLSTGGWVFQSTKSIKPDSAPKIVGQIYGGRVAFICRNNEDVKSILLAKDKTIELPSRKRMVRFLIDEGILPEHVSAKEVKEYYRSHNINVLERYRHDLDELEKDLLEGKIDMFLCWDAFLEELRDKNTIKIDRLIEPWAGAIIMLSRFIEQKPDIVVDFLIACKEAYFFTVMNKEMVNKWVGDCLGLSPEIIHRACMRNQMYRNATKWEEITFILPEEIRKKMAESVEMILKMAENPEESIYEIHLDFNLMEKAEEKAKKNGYLTPDAVKINESAIPPSKYK